MRRRLLAFWAFIIFFLVLARPEKVLAACSPPGDYRGCPGSPFGTNGVALMDSQYSPITTDFANLRALATQSDPSTTNQRIQATIILTDGTIADQGKTLAIFNNAEKYGIDMTIRTWGNSMPLTVATQMGKNLSAEVSAYQQATGQTVKVELGNEPNLDVNGNDYAAEFAVFAQTCSSCQIFLPSMGGTDLGAKQQFISEFMSNTTAASLAAKASGIVFNSYANTPQGAVTDWVKTLNVWQAQGLNTANMNFFLTETGPPNGDANWPNLNDFLGGIAAEYERIRSDPTDPNYQTFNHLEGLTFFVWTKDEKLILVYVDKNGKVTIKTSNPSANVPGVIPLSKKNIQSPQSSSYVHYPDESEEGCPNEGALNQQVPLQPYKYRPADGSPQRPEMRGDANLNFNTGVKGTHCGQSKSTPINLEEVAPYNLLQTPLCKEVGWAGEIQMNYSAPADVDLRIPFVQEITDKLAGTWDPEHTNECAMDNTARTAQGLPTQACTVSSSAAGSGSNNPAFVVPADVSKSAEYNLAVRGTRSVTEPTQLVNYGYEQPPDPQAPQLSSIVGTDPTQPGAFANTYRVQDSSGGDSPPWRVSAVGLASNASQTVNAPGGGHDIGGGKTYMVVYADQNSVTLVNGTADDPVNLYSVQLQNISLDPNLLAQYNQANAKGRSGLPQIAAGQAIGSAKGNEVVVAVRDSGEYMDPRSKLDWWQNYAGAVSVTATPFTNVGVTHLGGPSTSQQMAARATIEQKTGFLKKILAPQVQDKLKCDFVTYVKKQGANSMYANFAVDGIRLADIPCPPTAPQMLNMSAMDYNTWFVKWGKTWQRLALFPNERATGKLSFMVCDDRNYYINQAYPEVMRMGLTANTLFQLFTPKSSQDAYYGQPNFGDLRDPLNSQKLIGDNTNGTVLSFVPEVKTVDVAAKPPLIVAEARLAFDKIKQKIGGVWTELAMRLPFAGKLLAQATGTTVSQYPCGPLLCSIDVVDPNPGHFVYELVIQRTASSPPGTLGDIQINPPADWEAGMRASGQGVGPHIQSMTGTELRFLSTYEGANTFMPQVHSADELAAYTFTLSGDRLPEGYKFHNVAVQYKGGTGAAGAGTTQLSSCDPTTGIGCQCKETVTCPYHDPTGRAQLGPSDTEVWQYYKNHNLIGVDWKAFNAGLSNEASPNFVKLDWQIPAWHAGQRASKARPLPECSIEVPAKAEDRQVCSGPEDDATCGAPGNACNEVKGFCGTIMCTKIHERVVDVYNSVPFLASAWQQLAGVSSVATGVFSTWKAALNPSIEGNSQTLASGCSDSSDIVFDKYGNFVPNPGASQMYFSFDQHFGFAGENTAFGDFGKSQVSVTMTKPADGKAKILFYRIGGLCNALKWLSNSNLIPYGVKNPGALGTAGVSAGTAQTTSTSGTGFSDLTTAPGTTPTPASVVSTQPVPPAQVPTVVSQAAAALPGLPKTETPKVSTVISATNLASQPAFGSIQNGDQILVYQTAQQVYVFRPSTQKIIAQMPTVKFAVRNGTTTSAAFDTFAAKLLQLIPNAVITDRNDAQRKDYAATQIIDVIGGNGVATANLAVTLKIAVGKFPAAEPVPTNALYLIIVGADQTTQ